MTSREAATEARTILSNLFTVGAENMRRHQLVVRANRSGSVTLSSYDRDATTAAVSLLARRGWMCEERRHGGSWAVWCLHPPAVAEQDWPAGWNDSCYPGYRIRARQWSDESSACARLPNTEPGRQAAWKLEGR